MHITLRSWPLQNWFMLSVLIAIFFLAACGGLESGNAPKQSQTPAPSDESAAVLPEGVQVRPKILLITGQGFEASHYEDIHHSLKLAGYDIDIGSHTLDPIKNKALDPQEEEQTLQPDLLVSQADVSVYEAVVLINDWSGFMTGSYPQVYDLLHDALKQDKIVAAYDYTPLILGEAGLLEGVRATSHISAHDICSSLERSFGAICTAELWEKDGNILTADGFRCPASWFAEQVDTAIREKNQDSGLQ